KRCRLRTVMVEAGRHLWVLAIFVLACGSEDAPAAAGASSSGGSVGSGAEGGSAGSGGSAPGWQELLSRDWQVDPGSEKYVCVRKTLDRGVTNVRVGWDQPKGT